MTELDLGIYTIDYHAFLVDHPDQQTPAASFTVRVRSAFQPPTDYTFCSEPEFIEAVTPTLDYCAIAGSKGITCPPTSSSEVLCMAMR